MVKINFYSKFSTLQVLNPVNNRLINVLKFSFEVSYCEELCQRRFQNHCKQHQFDLHVLGIQSICLLYVEVEDMSIP